MKLKINLLLLFSILIGIQVFAKKGVFQYYKVLTDTIDHNIPEGKCLITGIVTHNGQSINEAEVLTAYPKREKTNWANTNKIGRFRILVDTADKYLIIRKKGVENGYFERYQFKNQHHIVVEIYIPDFGAEIIVDKPVIYAYSERPITFEIKLKTQCKLLFTYPKYNDSWKMQVDSSGMMVDTNNKEYPYLFWEGALPNLSFDITNQKIAGSYVTKQNVIDFLESKLAELGLNTKEQTDFITFWAPRMIQYENVFVQFFVDEAYNTISTMDITPKPDNIRRIYILYSGTIDLPKGIEIIAQRFDGFTRKGFTVVEWGGSELNTIAYSKR